MRQISREAWSILSEDEKTALGLQHMMQKSSWESGEIMDKSHYKYLEIKYRAEKFLAMFTEHLKLYQAVIPDYIPGDGAAIKFLTWCIRDRMKPMAALEKLNDNDLDRVYTKSVMNQKLIDQVKKWGKSESPYDLAVFNLVKEFDRWNNFRILPREIQEPSAFKRRVKNMYKKHIRSLTSIPELSRNKLIELSTAKAKDSKIGFLPILHEGRPFVIRAKYNQNINRLYIDLCFYVFKTRDEAHLYITNVFHYVNKSHKDCKDGIDFWLKYRADIEKAMNYAEIQKITATRSHLEMATKNLMFY